MNFTLSPAGLIILTMLSAWIGATVVILLVGNHYLRKSMNVEVKPKTLDDVDGSATIDDPEYYCTPTDLEIYARIFSDLRLNQDTAHTNQSLVIGYTNVPNESQTFEQKKAYPPSILILTHHLSRLDGIRLTIYPVLERITNYRQPDNIENGIAAMLRTAEPFGLRNAIADYANKVGMLTNSGFSLSETSSWVKDDYFSVDKRATYITALFEFMRDCSPTYLTKETQGTVWVHHSSSQQYVIIGGVMSATEPGVIYVVYANVSNGKIYSRPAKDWLRSMSIVMTPESEDSQRQALRVFKQITRE